MTYSHIVEKLYDIGIDVRELPLSGSDGRIQGTSIGIREDLESDTQKKCVLYEELGHLFTTVGDITRQDSIDAIKQEHRARRWAYRFSISLDDLYRAQEAGCDELWEAASFLGVTEKFLSDAIRHYELTYGPAGKAMGYEISFNPLRLTKI